MYGIDLGNVDFTLTLRSTGANFDMKTITESNFFLKQQNLKDLFNHVGTPKPPVKPELAKSLNISFL